MATFTWYLQGDTDTKLTSTDYLQFNAGSFDALILVGNYNSGTRVEDDTGSDKSSGNNPNNNKYISDTEIDIGSGTQNLDTISNGDAALKINFSHDSSVETFDTAFYTYGASTTDNPPDMTVQAAEVGDSSWTNAETESNPLALADQAAATSHDFYIAMSIKPTAIGSSKEATKRIELSYA